MNHHEEPRDQEAIVRSQRATLAAVLAAHVEVLPTRVSSGIALAVNELTDPATAPGYIEPADLVGTDPRAAVRDVRGKLRELVETAGVSTALSCARAERELAAVEHAWAITP